MEPLQASLLFLVNRDTGEVLMGRKIKKVGIRKYTGPGGKMEAEDVDIWDTAIR